MILWFKMGGKVQFFTPSPTRRRQTPIPLPLPATSEKFGLLAFFVLINWKTTSLKEPIKNRKVTHLKKQWRIQTNLPLQCQRCFLTTELIS